MTSMRHRNDLKEILYLFKKKQSHPAIFFYWVLLRAPLCSVCDNSEGDANGQDDKDGGGGHAGRPW